MAAQAPLFVSIEHLGSLPKLLYVLPLGIVAASCATIKVPFKGLCIGLGIGGVILSSLIILGGMQHLDIMAASFAHTTGRALPGFGGILAVLGYLGTIIAAMRHRTETPNVE